MANKLLDIIGIIVLFIGMFLAFLPHTLHVKTGLDENTSHIKHVIFGLIFVIISLGILVYNNKAFRFQK